MQIRKKNPFVDPYFVLSLMNGILFSVMSFGLKRQYINFSNAFKHKLRKY